MTITEYILLKSPAPIFFDNNLVMITSSNKVIGRKIIYLNWYTSQPWGI